MSLSLRMLRKFARSYYILHACDSRCVASSRAIAVGQMIRTLCVSSVYAEIRLESENKLNRLLAISDEDYKSMCVKFQSIKSPDIDKVFNPGRNKHIASTLAFLKNELGLDVHEQREVVLAAPAILELATGRIREKAAWFSSELQFSKDDVKTLLVQWPYLFHVSVHGNVEPKMRHLVLFGFSKAQFKACILRFPTILQLSLDDWIAPYFECLLEVGVSRDDIVEMVSGDPDILGVDFRGKCLDRLNFLSEEIGLDRAKFVRQFLPRNKVEGVLTILKTHEFNYKWLCKEGFDKSTCRKLVSLYPKRRIEHVSQKIEKIKFAQQHFGNSVEDILLCPGYFLHEFYYGTLALLAFLQHEKVDYRRMGLCALFGVKERELLAKLNIRHSQEFSEFKRRWSMLSRSRKLMEFKMGHT